MKHSDLFIYNNPGQLPICVRMQKLLWGDCLRSKFQFYGTRTI